MGSRDRVSAIVLLILSIVVCIGSTHYDLGNFHSPGTGFFPFLLGVVTGFLSLLIFVQTGSAEGRGEKQKIRSGTRGQKKVAYILLALVSYGLLVEKLGYTLTTFLLFIVLLRGIQRQRWYVVIGGALLASLGSYALFQLALHVQLPRGILGM